MLEWFSREGRRFPWRTARVTTYDAIISELLLQRTTASAVAAFVPGFLRRFPSWKSISQASQKELEEALKPVGLWRRRANSMKRLADEMVQLRGRFPREADEVRDLPGVGQYIGNAIQLYVQRRPQPLLDTNMARVLERCFGPRQLVDIRYDPYLQQTAAAVANCANSIQVNWAILDLAAAVCTPRNPRCADCPLGPRCQFNRTRVNA